jgi:hypothetical protein
MDTVIELLRVSIAAESSDEIKSAEKELNRLQTENGFSCVLLQILTNTTSNNKNNYELIRLAAAIQLSKIAKTYWTIEQQKLLSDEEKTINLQYGYTIGNNEKQQIKHILPQLLADSNTNIRKTICLIIEHIGECDFPEHWPELPPFLLNTITNLNNNSNINLVLGSLQCFGSLSGHLTHEGLLKHNS